MKDSIMTLLGVLVLSGGSNGNSYSYQEGAGEDYHHSPEISVYLSRIENLEERLDELESSMLLRDSVHAIPVERQYQDVPDFVSTKNMKVYAASDYYKEVFSTPFGCKMWVDYNQVFFEGCNVHIVNSTGLGGTEDRGNGLGNLIIGKNTCPIGAPNCDPVNPGYPSGADPNRMGSHNIIVGNGHTWTEEAVNSVVFGLENIIAGPNSAILGGRINKNSGITNAIVGGRGNIINQDTSESILVGGQLNRIFNAQFSVVTGGNSNVIQNVINTSLVGGSRNEITGNNSVILGGTDNTVISEDSSILGGSGNITKGKNSVIVSGENNITQGHHAYILGGRKNFAGGEYSSVLNGFFNQATGKHAMVSTGYLNSAKGDYSFVATGGGGFCQESGNWIWCLQRRGNIAEGNFTSIIGGYSNKSIGKYSAIISGSENTTPGLSSVVVGGSSASNTILPLLFPAYDGNSSEGRYSVIVGGRSNKAHGAYSGIFGGGTNETFGGDSVIIGGGGNHGSSGDVNFTPGNKTYGRYSVILGGANNKTGTFAGDSPSQYEVISGGMWNWAVGPYGSIFGGFTNTVVAPFASVLGGKHNSTVGESSVITGGMANRVYSPVSSVVGGLFNSAGVPPGFSVEIDSALKMRVFPLKAPDIVMGYVTQRSGITILGGYNNTVLNKLGTITGGYNNIIGNANENEAFCSECSLCSNELDVTYSLLSLHDPLLLDTLDYNCLSCMNFCSSSTSYTTAATVSGGYNNNIEAGGPTGFLYYMWLGGDEIEYYYDGCSNQYCM